MADDHAQRTLEQKALTNVRAQLDREDPDAPARSIGEAAAHMAKTLPIALAAVAAAIALLVWLTPRAPEKPKTRAMYAVGVSQQVEYLSLIHI